MYVAFICIHQNGSRINVNMDIMTSTQLSLVLHDFFVILGAGVFCSVQVKNFLQYISIIVGLIIVNIINIIITWNRNDKNKYLIASKSSSSSSSCI